MPKQTQPKIETTSTGKLKLSFKGQIWYIEAAEAVDFLWNLLKAVVKMNEKFSDCECVSNYHSTHEIYCCQKCGWPMGESL